MALWVEKNFGNTGQSFIENKISEHEEKGQTKGAALWRKVRDCFSSLRRPLVPIAGQKDNLDS